MDKDMAQANKMPKLAATTTPAFASRRSIVGGVFLGLAGLWSLALTRPQAFSDGATVVDHKFDSRELSGCIFVAATPETLSVTKYLSRAFLTEHPQVRFKPQAGTAAEGFAALMNGATHALVSPRCITPSESLAMAAAYRSLTQVPLVTTPDHFVRPRHAPSQDDFLLLYARVEALDAHPELRAFIRFLQANISRALHGRSLIHTKP